ncbi:hypothetical protein ACUXIS_004502 [Cytobacillus horneckiae]
MDGLGIAMENPAILKANCRFCDYDNGIGIKTGWNDLNQ